jgi:hypothetical protein
MQHGQIVELKTTGPAGQRLRAGLGTDELSRYMGTSLINIDRTYGHLAHDGHHHAIQRLDDYNSHCRDVDARGCFVDVDSLLTPLATTTKTC